MLTCTNHTSATSRYAHPGRAAWTSCLRCAARAISPRSLRIARRSPHTAVVLVDRTTWALPRLEGRLQPPLHPTACRFTGYVARGSMREIRRARLRKSTMREECKQLKYMAHCASSAGPSACRRPAWMGGMLNFKCLQRPLVCSACCVLEFIHVLRCITYIYAVPHPHPIPFTDAARRPSPRPSPRPLQHNWSSTPRWRPAPALAPAPAGVLSDAGRFGGLHALEFQRGLLRALHRSHVPWECNRCTPHGCTSLAIPTALGRA